MTNYPNTLDEPAGMGQSNPTLRQRMFAWMTVKSEASSERMLNEKKHQLFQDIAGTVVEIGPGTGVNLPYYPADIRWIAIEPNPAMHSHLQQRANKHPLAAEIRQGTDGNKIR